jgi:phosphoserine phosphatase
VDTPAIDSSSSLARILDVARKLSRPFELKEALEQIVDTGCHVLGADRASVFLFDAPRNQLFSKATSSRNEEIRFDADKGIAGECLKNRRILRVDDCYEDPRFNPEVDRATGYRSESLLAIPLVGMEEEVVGVMQLLNSARGRFDEDDERLADLFAGFAALAIQRARNLEDRLRTAKLENDLSLAREIQVNLLPREVPSCEGYELAAYSRPAEETGGDIYDLVPLDGKAEEGELLMLLADATGHGIGAALSVTQVRSMLRTAARAGVGLDQIGLSLNNQLAEDLPANRFITAFLGVLDPARHTLSYHALGQGPLLHFHAGTGSFDELGASSIPMGIVKHSVLPRPDALVLEPGDLVVLLSDGFYEYRSPEDEEFGAARVRRIASENRAESASSILDALKSELDGFARGAPQLDDLTAVVLKRL